MKDLIPYVLVTLVSYKYHIKIYSLKKKIRSEVAKILVRRSKFLHITKIKFKKHIVCAGRYLPELSFYGNWRCCSKVPTLESLTITSNLPPGPQNHPWLAKAPVHLPGHWLLLVFWRGRASLCTYIELHTWFIVSIKLNGRRCVLCGNRIISTGPRNLTHFTITQN